MNHSLLLPVIVEKKVPYEVKVPVDRPYKVEVEKPYPGMNVNQLSAARFIAIDSFHLLLFHKSKFRMSYYFSFSPFPSF